MTFGKSSIELKQMRKIHTSAVHKNTGSLVTVSDVDCTFLIKCEQ